MFYLRILKEHAYFIAVSIPSKNSDFIQEAMLIINTYNNLLSEAITLSSGIINLNNDAITDYTLNAEKITSILTGVPINTDLTTLQMKFPKEQKFRQKNNVLIENVSKLNLKSLNVTRSLIKFKTKIYENVKGCKLHSSLYPHLLDHIRKEAIFFVDSLNKIQEGHHNNIEVNLYEEPLRVEAFWAEVMNDHAKFIRGFLDPTEEQLMKTADDFAKRFELLYNNLCANIRVQKPSAKLFDDVYLATKEIAEFKKQATIGILECKVKTIALPLLADHVYREANRFIKILDSINS